jgi:hypothetical protein
MWPIDEKGLSLSFSRFGRIPLSLSLGPQFCLPQEQAVRGSWRARKNGMRKVAERNKGREAEERRIGRSQGQSG